MKQLLIIFLIVLAFSTTNAVERTYTISMMGSVIGKSSEIWTETKDITGKCIIKLESVSKMGVTRGAYSVNMESRTVVKVSCSDFSPVSVESESSELSSKMTSSASNLSGALIGEIIKNSNREQVSVPIPPNTTFFSMIFKKFSENDFLKGGNTQVISEESLTLKKISYSAQKDLSGLLKVSINYDGIVLDFTLDKGIVVRSELQNGLILYQLDGHSFPSQATSGVEPTNQGKNDIMSNTFISNNGVLIRYPRAATKMNFSLSGDHLKEIPLTCFQKRSDDGTILSVDSSIRSCATLPKPEDTKSNLFEDSNNSGIIATAQKIAAGAPNKNEIIKRVTNFVFKHIKDKNYNHGNLSASEVLFKKAGDCTEHSTLFSALLKALNIPVKMAYGVVLDGNGKFMFHNWNEAYGDYGWVSVDSTFGKVNADAARIVLVYGGSNSSSRENVSLAVLKFLGTLKISVNGFVNE